MNLNWSVVSKLMEQNSLLQKMNVAMDFSFYTIMCFICGKERKMRRRLKSLSKKAT